MRKLTLALIWLFSQLKKRTQVNAMDVSLCELAARLVFALTIRNKCMYSSVNMKWRRICEKRWWKIIFPMHTYSAKLLASSFALFPVCQLKLYFLWSGCTVCTTTTKNSQTNNAFSTKNSKSYQPSSITIKSPSSSSLFPILPHTHITSKYCGVQGFNAFLMPKWTLFTNYYDYLEVIDCLSWVTFFGREWEMMRGID